MNIEDIENDWTDEARVDTTNIEKEAANQPLLHHKYLIMYRKEAAILAKLKNDFEQLRSAKYKHYDNPTYENKKYRNWEPAGKKLTKGEIQFWLDGDEELSLLKLKVELQSNKVDYLKSILDNINQRGYLIKNIIENRRWEQGS